MSEDTPSIAAQVLALQKLTVAELRIRWKDLTGEVTTQRSKPYLVKRCVWLIQQRYFGTELSEGAKERLHELQAEFRNSPPETWFRGARHNRPATGSAPVQRKPVRDAKALKVGTTLVRDYKGTRITVTVVEGGFMYDNEFFKSLSAIAKAVTGSHCSGVAFFNATGKGVKR
jgi:hypothetical protein